MLLHDRQLARAGSETVAALQPDAGASDGAAWAATDGIAAMQEVESVSQARPSPEGADDERRTRRTGSTLIGAQPTRLPAGHGERESATGAADLEVRVVLRPATLDVARRLVFEDEFLLADGRLERGEALVPFDLLHLVHGLPHLAGMAPAGHEVRADPLPQPVRLAYV